LSNNAITESNISENFGAEKNKLFPTDIGMIVTDFLSSKFNNILDYGFTAAVEKEFDEIAEGLQNWTKMIDSFYHPFHKDVERTLAESERANGVRLLGVDPKTGKNIYTRIGRYGALAQIGENEDEEKKFANLRQGQRLESLTFEEALELFKLPRTLAEFEGKDMVVGTGRFGPYIRHNSSFYSLAKTDDPLSVDEERAIEIILNKRKIGYLVPQPNKVKATTAGSGQFQANRGTTTNAEPKPVRPSTV
jgi:DNA topoisomerase-1